MKSINFAFLGGEEIARQLGKKGTTTDLAVFDRKGGDSIYTWTVPISYPDKIQSLFQSLNMSEYVILHVTKLDKSLGEQIIAINSLGLCDGIILMSYDVDEGKLKSLIRGTSLEKFVLVHGIESLKEEIQGLEPKKYKGPLLLPIDHAFEVKGVGTVALGVIKQGSLKVHDEFQIHPQNKQILVKSIQMHDDSVSESESPSRVGIALKGLSADFISRGDVISSPGYILDANEETVKASFEKNIYYKEEVSENRTYSISIGLQIKPVKLKLIDKIEILPEKPISFYQDQKFVILNLDSSKNRIVGNGSFSSS
mgnify:FL=1